MVLCQDTDYVLLDEPLNNLDMKHAMGMMKTLRKAANELGKTVVLVLHDINFASWYSDYIVAMRNGKVCHEGPAAKIVTPEVLSDVYDMEIKVHEIGGQRVSLYYE
jgi:iron complex transport system ATP-binding protein